MKSLLLFLTVSLSSFALQAQDDSKLIENLDPTLQQVSYQTVFVTFATGKDKFNIKFWKFSDKFSISCFVVTKDTFCVDPSSSVTFSFDDHSHLTFNSDKKQNCRGELDKDYRNEAMPDETFALATKKIASIKVQGSHAEKRYVADDRIAAAVQRAFRCIIQKKIK